MSWKREGENLIMEISREWVMPNSKTFKIKPMTVERKR